MARTPAWMTDQVAVALDDRPSPPSMADRTRLERMFAAHHAIVWRTLRRRGLSHDAAADATQETFLIAAGRLSDIRPDSERAFLIRTALRVAHTLARKTARWQLEDDMDQWASTSGEGPQQRADVELCDLALSKLDPTLGDVFLLYEIEGFSAPEIASLLEIPVGSVASRLRRAREQFRAAITRIERSMNRIGGRR
jgi:RNA polymerase sigma-70 factor (ECF subfamily)